ncbi:hypothetical protein KTS45_01645 [Halomicroarcula limicola]|uniref:Uncharacterized protein n=1 Tax=Haloarcula limicola TaxID=1429915 RepID=A0A8J7Y748_9EURY|nr:hypothetical protein [Halomicroarcula limicola]MBV0922893.1 hypothetical protein [Halomicroarcula limicola]
MPAPWPSDFDSASVVCALLTLLSAALVGRAVRAGDDLVAVSLLGVQTLYLFGAAVPRIHERVPHYRRSGAILLGGFGGVALLAGSSSDLPTLYVCLGICAAVDLYVERRSTALRGE